MINRVVIVGRLSRDPELRKTNNGTSVASITVAVDNIARDSEGNKTASFIPVTLWNQRADFIAQYGRKGTLIGVEGRLNQRSYKRNDGSNANVIEVIADNVTLLGSKSSKDSAADENSGSGYTIDKLSNDDLEDTELADEDLPF